MALREAARMRETSEDPYFIAKVLLNQNFRIRQLEAVLERAGQYLENNDSEELADELAEAIEKAEGAQTSTPARRAAAV